MALRVQIGRIVRDTRVAIGWTQSELARRARTAQSTISRIETVKLKELTVETAGAVLGALGVRVSLDLRAPFLADRGRQRDAGHARCIAYVARRLERLGWITLTEVELAAGTARGWIDILAFQASDGMLLVIEVKTELSDVGLTQRQVAWYVRSAWRSAREQGWRPAHALGVLLVLATALAAAGRAWLVSLCRLRRLRVQTPAPLSVRARSMRAKHREQGNHSCAATQKAPGDVNRAWYGDARCCTRMDPPAVTKVAASWPFTRLVLGTLDGESERAILGPGRSRRAQRPRGRPLPSPESGSLTEDARLSSNVAQSYPYTTETEAERDAAIGRAIERFDGLADKIAADSEPLADRGADEPGRPHRSWVFVCPEHVSGRLHVAGYARERRALFTVCDEGGETYLR